MKKTMATIINDIIQMLNESNDRTQILQFSCNVLQSRFDLGQLEVRVRDELGHENSYFSPSSHTSLFAHQEERPESNLLKQTTHQNKNIHINQIGLNWTIGIAHKDDTSETDNQIIDKFVSNVFTYIYTTFEQDYMTSKLKETKILLQTIIDTIPQKIAYKTLDGIYQVVNKSVDIDHSTKFSTIVGKSIDQVYPKKDALFVKELDKEAIDLNKTINREFQMRTDSGYLWVNSTRTPVYDDNNQMIGLVSIATDISEEKRTKASLAYYNQFQQILMHIATQFINTPLDYLDDTIHTSLGLVGSFINADRAYVFEYLFDKNTLNNTHEWCSEGIEPQIDQLQNGKISDFISEWVEKHVRGEIVLIRDIEEIKHQEVLYNVLSMQDIKSLITIPILNQTECIGFVGFDSVKEHRVWDSKEEQLLKVLSELYSNLLMKRENEKKLNQAKLQAEAANIAKSVFLANMSHEIRNPLSGIFNAIYLLNNSRLDREQKEFIDIANTSLESLSEIVNNILDLSKIEAKQLKLEVSENNLEHELLKIIKANQITAVNKNLKLMFDFDYNIPMMLMFDKKRIRQIILNLISNAIKYTIRGEVILKVVLKEIKEESICIDFSVIDTGIGIPAEHIPRLTDMFYQLNNHQIHDTERTGLGLTIVNELVKALGGTLHIESQVDQGSIFSFALTFGMVTNLQSPILSWSKSVHICYVYAHQNSNLASMFPNIVSISYQNVNKHHSPCKCDVFIFDDTISELSSIWIAKLKQAFDSMHAISILVSEYESYDQVQTNHYGCDISLTLPVSRMEVYESIEAFANKHVVELKSKSLMQWDTFKKERILVVDDNFLNRRSLEILLIKEGFLVDTAASGYDAIDMVKKNAYTLILMDIRMPGIDGLETAKVIHKINKESNKIPIVAVSANAMEQEIAKAMDSGMVASITKPINHNNLLQIISQFTSKDVGEIHQRDDNTSVYEHIIQVDEASFASQFQDNIELRNQIIQIYLDEEHTDMQKLKVAIETTNYEDIGFQAHYMKGTYSYLSALKAAQMCEELIKASKKQDMNTIRVTFGDLTMENESLIQILKSMKERNTL